MPETLNSVFTKVAYKSLASVDLPRMGPGHSHQHELNGVSALKEFFRHDAYSGRITWIFFSDTREPLRDSGNYNFYDARATSADRTGRTEWRMYYSGEFLANASPGDALILARTTTGTIFGLIFEHDSAWLRAARVLFPVEEFTRQMRLFNDEYLQAQKLEFARRRILEELGLDIELTPNANDMDLAVRELAQANAYGLDFPSTRTMAGLAQDNLQVDFRDGDSTLIAFLDREERLFRAIEKIGVEAKLQQGFDSIDDFISYSLSIQNRRKARMGYALQNHLDRIFSENNLRFNAQVRTEGKNTADFIFPGDAEYHNTSFPSDLLVMLAAKSSCKERWRQILDEADRIPSKHLCTLEAAISVDQTRAMVERNVQLVIPASIHSTYTQDQLTRIWSLNQFMDHVRFIQGRS